MNNSLRRQLLAWVLVPLACAVTVDASLTFQSAEDTAFVVQDRLLLGSARMIAQQISFEDGTFQHSIPPAALELFQAQESDRIYYRVTTGTGQLLSGYTDLPMPHMARADESSVFFNTKMRGQDVRIVAFYQPVVGNPSLEPVVVEVAQTTHGRNQLTRHLWLMGIGQQLLILALASTFILYGLNRGLRPLMRLRKEMQMRKEGSLQLLHTDGIPAELTPLVDSFNDYMQRLEHYTSQRNIVTQNAAHQLRTPLAVLHTQVSDALRAQDKPSADAIMLAARTTLKQTSRLVHQFLTLSSTEAFVPDFQNLTPQDCVGILTRTLEELAAQAHARDIDLGFESDGVGLVICADPVALREIARNLIENAIRYTTPGGMVTVGLHFAAQQMSLSVEDNGPGVAAQHQEKIFERFFRVDGTDSSGSGLGLAIVKELAVHCGANIRVEPPRHGGQGLRVVVEFAEQPLGVRT